MWFQYKETILRETFICFILDSESRIKVYANRGDNITLPCKLDSLSAMFGNRIKWTKLEDDSTETDVLMSMGFHKKTYGNFQDRVYLLEADDNDATLVFTNLDLKDYGTYRCEIINGLNDKTVEVDLELQGNFHFLHAVTLIIIFIFIH